jgi:hypothetical protein
VYVPAEPEHDRVEVPVVVVLLRETLVGDSVHERPVPAETVEDNAIVPVNPCRPETVTVEVAGRPARTVRVAGLAEIVKS